jgi:hypothetical protein
VKSENYDAWNAYTGLSVTLCTGDCRPRGIRYILVGLQSLNACLLSRQRERESDLGARIIDVTTTPHKLV